MDLEDTAEFDQLATLVSGYANTTRLALLIGFSQGYTATDVTDFLGVSRPGAQKNIERMVDADLVYRPAADDAPTYALTPLGEYFADIFSEDGIALLAAIATLQQTEANVRQQLRDSPLADGLSQADTDKLVHTKKWQQADDMVSELLEFATEDQDPMEADSSPPRSVAFESDVSTEKIKAILEEVREAREE